MLNDIVEIYVETSITDPIRVDLSTGQQSGFSELLLNLLKPRITVYNPVSIVDYSPYGKPDSSIREIIQWSILGLLTIPIIVYIAKRV